MSEAALKLPEETDGMYEPESEVVPDKDIIMNPYFGKERLTPDEAIDSINRLSAMLIVYGRR